MKSMSRIFFIGGAPRSGKSTVLQKFVEQKPMLAASTDAIRAAAKSMSSPEQNPRLFKTDRGRFDSEQNIARMAHDAKQALTFQLGEAEETWKATLDFVKYYVRDGRDAIVEGVAVLPSKLPELPFDFRAVFIVNLNDQTDTILRHAHENKDDWLNKYDDNTIRAFCHSNQAWNKYYAEEAAKYGYEIIKVETDRFEENINDAVKALIQD
jgi:2-phosphoglycerate kinase